MEVAAYAIAYALLAFVAACSPLPLFGRSRIYGRKSILEQTDTEWQLSRLERERDTIRYCVLMLAIPLVMATLMRILG